MKLESISIDAVEKSHRELFALIRKNISVVNTKFKLKLTGDQVNAIKNATDQQIKEVSYLGDHHTGANPFDEVSEFINSFQMAVEYKGVVHDLTNDEFFNKDGKLDDKLAAASGADKEFWTALKTKVSEVQKEM